MDHRDAPEMGPSGRADASQRAGFTIDEKKRLKELDRENHELKRAKEILRKASRIFAQEDRDS